VMENLQLGWEPRINVFVKMNMGSCKGIVFVAEFFGKVN